MSGMIEAWGRDFDKIKEACERYEGPLPEYDIKKSGIMVLCKACDRYLRLLSGKEDNSLISNERIDERKNLWRAVREIKKGICYKGLNIVAVIVGQKLQLIVKYRKGSGRCAKEFSKNRYA